MDEFDRNAAQAFRRQQAKLFSDAEAADRVGNSAEAALYRSQAEVALIYAQAHEGVFSFETLEDRDLIRQFELFDGYPDDPTSAAIAAEMDRRGIDF